MLFRLRKYIAAFTLAVFLLPMAGEAGHTFNHEEDFHCTEKTAQHFHKLEHHCPICDFVPAVSDNPVQHNSILVVTICTSLSFTFYKNSVVEKHDYNFSLRAPPAIS